MENERDFDNQLSNNNGSENDCFIYCCNSNRKNWKKKIVDQWCNNYVFKSHWTWIIFSIFLK